MEDLYEVGESFCEERKKSVDNFCSILPDFGLKRPLDVEETNEDDPPVKKMKRVDFNSKPFVIRFRIKI